MATDGSPFSGDFATDVGFEFDVRLALGHAPFGGSDPGEVLAAVRGIAPSDHIAWCDAWRTLGERTVAAAIRSRDAGHRVSAAAGLLRGANYLGTAVSAAAALEDASVLPRVFRSHRAAWAAFLETRSGRSAPIDIPYEGASMPGWIFSAAVPTGRTLVLNNGSDECVSALYTDLAVPALARGWNVVIFDGPGQQSMLFERGIPFRPDWERVLTPVLDALTARADIGGDRLALWGVSQAGYWVPRALTAEHRFTAAVADPGVVDVAASWEAHLPPVLLQLLDAGEDDTFDAAMNEGMPASSPDARLLRFRSRPYGRGDRWSAVYRAVREYRLHPDAVAGIRTPLLITDPDREQFWPGQSEQLEQMASGIATRVRFTASEGADGHCQPMARALTAERGFDWLDERVPADA